jgi:hypothetical protein
VVAAISDCHFSRRAEHRDSPRRVKLAVAASLFTCAGSFVPDASTDCGNHRVQIFDNEGNYKRQFGTEGKEEDGQFFSPTSLASDAHGNLRS